jgi:hypothetical protein
MSQGMNLGDGACCRPSVPGLRMLTLPNGAQIGIIGLDAAMEDLYKERTLADETSAAEIMRRLEGQNYFSPSSRKIYQDSILSEYQRFYQTKTALLKKESITMANQENNQDTKKKGIFNIFKSDKKASHGGGCCDMKIVPVEEEESPAKTKADAKNKSKKDNPGGGCCGGGSCC